MTGTVARLVREGAAIWLEGLHRDRLGDGTLHRLATGGGVTGARFHPAAAWDVQDVREACDTLRPVHLRSGLCDGLVSVPLGPWPDSGVHELAAAARDLHRRVGRPNLLVQIPAREDTTAAVTACLAGGVGVDAAQIFSAARYGQVADAFMTGLERAVARGHDPAALASVASVPLARYDVVVDGLLDKAGTHEAKSLRGRAATVHARLLHRLHTERFGSARWSALAAAGARPQRLLWEADTPRYAEDLVAPGTVGALTTAALDALTAHGVAGGGRVRRRADIERTSACLAWCGVDADEVARTLEESAADALFASQAERAIAALGGTALK